MNSTLHKILRMIEGKWSSSTMLNMEAKMSVILASDSEDHFY